MTTSRHKPRPIHPMFLISSASVGPHGQDRRRRAKTNDDAGCGLKIPPNFSFARVLAALGGTQNCEDGP
ncbi:hypothetical protein N7491_002670 [Penicillium cf. griseofulvum]|nr:hypothetical protein N7491_002670 [Penicillium cf. griseofulvum]KAJ5448313.1 hypothetical protein N7445_003134 [Penicillium cf. griseofulvum]